MRRRVRLALVMLLLTTGCAGSPAWYSMRISETREEAERNVKKMAELRVGQRRDEVLALMGPPARTEAFTVPDGQPLELLYYRTKGWEAKTWTAAFGSDKVDDTPDQFTPIGLKDGVVTGWGKSVLLPPPPSPGGPPVQSPALRAGSVPDDLALALRTTRNLAKRKLRGRDLAGLDLSYVDLRDADLAGANLDGANLQGAQLAEADLARASLVRSRLDGASLFRADLGRANLAGATLIAADLGRADLEAAVLDGAVLAGAILARADLKKASLRGTNLELADLYRANLEEADLDGARFVSAYLFGARNIESARNVERARGFDQAVRVVRDEALEEDASFLRARHECRLDAYGLRQSNPQAQVSVSVADGDLGQRRAGFEKCMAAHGH